MDLTSLDPAREGAPLRSLPRTLGQGEAAAIAIAYHRGDGVAIDDRRAGVACQPLVPPDPWIATETILGTAISDGFLTAPEAEEAGAATSMGDPTRFIW